MGTYGSNHLQICTSLIHLLTSFLFLVGWVNRTNMQHIDSGLDVKPTISCTKAHIKMTELDLANSTGSIEVDGKIVTKSQILPAFPENDPGIEVNTYKAAIEPVWHLPGLAKRFDVSEELLRRALFEGMSFLHSFLLKI
jgi:copper chaperone CopZ